MGRSKVGEFLTGLDMYGHPIGVHYKGSDTYQTQIGSLLTIVTYVVMIINLVTLLTAFNDGSEQQEKTSTNFVDSFVTDAYGLKEHNFDIVLMSSPPPPKSVGMFWIRHDKEGEDSRLIKQTPCKELPDRQASLDAYWTPRLGEKYLGLKDD